MVKVTVYIPAHNYGRYIDKAIQSVLKQTMDDWELIIIDDGSTDNTNEILAEYGGHQKIRIVKQENRGLNVTNNIALRVSNGRYVIRLDADDYFDENILLVLSNVLDTKPDVSLVYPDYYHIDEIGEVVEIVRRKKIGEEVELLDLPAHGACTMFRRDLLLEMGGYIEDFSCQDGYELWLRFIQKYKPFNINLPLFYYRRHPASITNDQARILETRGKIKSRFVKNHFQGAKIKILGIVLAAGNPICPEMHPFIDVGGKPLIWYTLSEAVKAESLDKIVVSSDDEKVLEYAKGFEKVIPLRRHEEQAKTSAKTYDILKHVVSQVRESLDYKADAVMALYINTPLRKAYHIDKAINTMMIFDVDSVISIQEELSPCYQHKEFGLTPVNDVSHSLRIERNAIYKENGALYLSKAHVLESSRLLGKKIGHVTMLPEESVKINNAFDLWLAEKILTRG